jgi:hypothetical protein
MAYDPPRRTAPHTTGDPLEIDLVYNVRSCGTCGFFWPENGKPQPYGPYPSWDFTTSTPRTAEPSGNPVSFAWVKGKTRPPSFPDAEVMDGCRKAPIMTIGINPNLTAFLPGQAGASWCYPSFSSDAGSDSWTKYAYYYRYRSVYQERFDLGFAERYLDKSNAIVAAKPGVFVSADRPSDAPSFTIKVRYDGEAQDTAIAIPGALGEPRYVLLFDTFPPHNRFAQGAVIAGRLDVPAGHAAEVYAQQIGYYERIVPMLDRFNAFLKAKGHDAHLRVGEDVGQLDMVACASPHWGPPWLGGSAGSVRTIIGNCVQKNAWALKQLLQTRPAVLILVGEASFDMFRSAFGHLITPALAAEPDDGAFTLLRATTDMRTPCVFKFAATVDGHHYGIATRLVVAPHFSYASNFTPQFRMRHGDWDSFQQAFSDCAKFLKTDPRLARPAASGPFTVIAISKDADAVAAHLKTAWPDAWARLTGTYYDPNAMIEGVFEDAFDKHALSFVAPSAGHPGYLARTDGPCVFCDNRHWKFPLGCPYGKPKETPLPNGWLEKVAAQILSSGTSARAALAAPVTGHMLDDGFEARRTPPPYIP